MRTFRHGDRFILRDRRNDHYNEEYELKIGDDGRIWLENVATLMVRASVITPPDIYRITMDEIDRLSGTYRGAMEPVEQDIPL